MSTLSTSSSEAILVAPPLEGALHSSSTGLVPAVSTSPACGDALGNLYKSYIITLWASAVPRPKCNNPPVGGFNATFKLAAVITLPFTSKSPPSCGVISSTTSPNPVPVPFAVQE